jgi:hypothetical protein
MTGLFVALGIAILTLLAILLWFVPHLLQQQALQVAHESAQLREMIGEMINEQEAVAMRQVQLGTSVSLLQDQLDLVRQENEQGVAPLARFDPDTLQMLETRVSSLQVQIDQQMYAARIHNGQENESWVYLLGLLTAIQERIRVLSEEHPGTAPTHTSPGCDHHWN